MPASSPPAPGAFSFDSSLSTVGLGDLASFDFALEENTPNTVMFGLTDLTSFSASVGPGPTLSSLSLTDRPGPGLGPGDIPQRVHHLVARPSRWRLHILIFMEFRFS